MFHEPRLQVASVTGVPPAFDGFKIAGMPIPSATSKTRR
jgi:hypothetical protein